MRTFPDVLGMELSEALSLMEKNGRTVQVCRTEPDRGKPEEGYDKVIKQEPVGDSWILTVCRVPDAYR